jgi:succinate dehydrogenase / fumarate reductase iron-sulfur subunit
MVQQMSIESFGACGNIGECEAVCPKRISIENIARMNRDYMKAAWLVRPEVEAGGAG